MKKVIVVLLVSICFCNCSEKKKTINFTTLHETEFNTTQFKLPNVRMPDSMKHVHDSCMGFSFDANAVLAQTKDTFFIGSVIKRQSLKVVNTLNDLGLTQAQLISEFNVLSTPCYEKKVLNFPLKSILGEKFILQLQGADKVMNKEINDAVSASNDAEMQTGSWVYLDMKDALKRIVDTTKSAAGVRYRKNMLDTANMVLTTAESITDISFIINTEKSMSKQLQALLKNKPAALPLNSKGDIRLFYINNNKFEISVNGFFPMAGQFMKAELK